MIDILSIIFILSYLGDRKVDETNDRSRLFKTSMNKFKFPNKLPMLKKIHLQ